MRARAIALGFWLVAGAASAQVRAAPHGEAIAVAERREDGFAIAWSHDGVRFDPVALGTDRWVLDLFVTDDALLVAHSGVPRGEDLTVTRYDASGTTSEVLAGASSMSNAHFVATPAGIALATADTVHLADADGRGFRLLTTFPEGAIDLYAFYAASFASSPSGLDLLAPVFDTCGSSDGLEELTRWHVDPSGHTSHGRVPLAGARAAAIGRGAIVYGVVETYVRIAEGEEGPHDTMGCGLAVLHGGDASGRILRRSATCDFRVGSNDHFTVAVFGGSVVRLRGASAVLLGTLAQSDVAASVTPDARGRALVLFDDGRIVRFATGEAPVIVRPTR